MDLRELVGRKTEDACAKLDACGVHYTVEKTVSDKQKSYDTRLILAAYAEKDGIRLVEGNFLMDVVNNSSV